MRVEAAVFKTHRRQPARRGRPPEASRMNAPPPARHRSPAEPAPHRGRDSSTEVGIPTSVFAEKPITGPAPKVRALCCPRSITPGVFFPPFTRPAVNPGVGTGLPHSILAWAQDCHTQSWRGHRIAPVFPRKRWKRSAAQHYAPRLAARIARKTTEAHCCIAGRSRKTPPASCCVAECTDRLAARLPGFKFGK